MSRWRDPIGRDVLLNADLPRMPFELADRGLCAHHPEPGLWSSPVAADRQAAVQVCRRCPVLDICAAWSSQLPWRYRTGVIYAAQVPPADRIADRAAG